MFIYDLLDGGMVFVEGGGERGPVAGGFGLVDQQVGSGGACCFLFEVFGVLARVSTFFESFLKCGHGFVGVLRGRTNFLGPKELPVWDVVDLFWGVVGLEVQVGVSVCGFAV